MDNGWYIWEPYEQDDCPALSLHQVVQVIEGEVWATMTTSSWAVEEARQYGRFKEKVYDSDIANGNT